MRNSILLAVILTLVVSVTVPAFAANDANKAVVQKQAAKEVAPIGWWKLDEKDGNTAKDSSGNGFDATIDLGGGPSIWSAGQGFDSKGCATFEGKQIVLIPNGVWGKVKQQLSIAFWVNQDVNNPPGEQWPGPWGCAPTDGLTYPDPNWLALRAFVPTPNKTVDIGKDSEHVFWEPFDPNTYTGTWNLYVFVKDANEHTMKLFHNGVTVAANFEAMDPMPKINNFFLGGREYPTANWFGQIDDFRIYNTALSQDDVQKLFDSKPAKKTK